jgi:hypothetical protein
MSGPIKIKQTSNRRRFGGIMLSIIALPLTILWLWLGFPPRFVFADLIFLLGGPGMLGLGLWAAFWPSPPRTRLAISADELVVHTGGKDNRPTIIKWTDLTRVTQTGMSANTARLRFEATTGDAELPTALLDQDPPEILRLITIQLENMGRHLSQTTSPVLGAATGVWAVKEGIPFKTN